MEQHPSFGRPWAWSTNYEALKERIVGMMRRVGFEETLLEMKLAGPEENSGVDEDWDRVLGQVRELTGR